MNMNSSKVLCVAMAFMVAMVIVVRADRDSISVDLEDALSQPNGGSAYCQVSDSISMLVFENVGILSLLKEKT